MWQRIKKVVCVTYDQEDLQVIQITFFSHLKVFHMEDDTVLLNTDPEGMGDCYMICWARGCNLGSELI